VNKHFEHKLTYLLISNCVKWLPASSCRKGEKEIRSCDDCGSLETMRCHFHCIHLLQCHRQPNSESTVLLPNKKIALTCPNPGTSIGFPCITELSPALSRSRTKLSEYCWILDTVKTSLNVTITSPLMLLGRQEKDDVAFHSLDTFLG